MLLPGAWAAALRIAGSTRRNSRSASEFGVRKSFHDSFDRAPVSRKVSVPLLPLKRFKSRAN
eukprot:1848793-Pyramimonas_sp.AAC.1